MLLILFVLNPVLNGENALLFDIFRLFVVIGEIPLLNVKAGIVLLLVLFELNPVLNVVNVLLLFVIGGFPVLNVNAGIVLLLVIFVLFIIGDVPVSFNRLLIDPSFEVEGTSNFDSYLLPEDDRNSGNGLTSYRLLTVDNHLFIPTEVSSRILVSSADVLHSWAVPSLGVKIDACPGRLNQTSLFIKRQGLYYGQCSEICGVNHGFMPIGIYSYDIDFARPMLENSSKLMASLDPLLSGLCAVELE